MATQLIEGLHVDFDADTTITPESFAASNIPNRLSSTQPETFNNDAQFEWDRPWQSASQPLHTRENFDSYDFLISLAEDPAMSQFAPQPQLPLSLVGNPCSTHTFIFSLLICSPKTQNAQRFEDICPSQRMTRFYSSFSFRQILPILGSALHRLGVAVPPFKKSELSDGNTETWISIKTFDSRKCSLRGEILVERIAPKVLQISFSKSTGDPLEWRRFFKVRNYL